MDGSKVGLWVCFTPLSLDWSEEACVLSRDPRPSPALWPKATPQSTMSRGPAQRFTADTRFTVDDEEDDANEFTLPPNPLTGLDNLDDLPDELRHVDVIPHVPPPPPLHRSTSSTAR
jgi:hypothetical protein